MELVHTCWILVIRYKTFLFNVRYSNNFSTYLRLLTHSSMKIVFSAFSHQNWFEVPIVNYWLMFLFTLSEYWSLIVKLQSEDCTHGEPSTQPPIVPWLCSAPFFLRPPLYGLTTHFPPSTHPHPRAQTDITQGVIPGPDVGPETFSSAKITADWDLRLARLPRLSYCMLRTWNSGCGTKNFPKDSRDRPRLQYDNPGIPQTPKLTLRAITRQRLHPWRSLTRAKLNNSSKKKKKFALAQVDLVF